MDTIKTVMDSSSMVKIEHQQSKHPLYDKWVLWAHLPHDTDWTIKSYQKIMKMFNVEDMLSLYSAMPEKLIKNCMLFLMRDGINPTWEDPANKEGGCFSYKIDNGSAESIWKRLSYFLISENISDDLEFMSKVNGITISPKKHFCILKLWMKDCTYETNDKINCLISDEFTKVNCIFKKHV